MFGTGGHLMYLPFDPDYRPGETGRDNRIRLSQVGQRPSWYFFVDFAPLDPQDPAYPHYVQVQDEGDFANIRLTAHWSERAGIQNGYGPIPTEPGKRRVRFTLLNKDQQPLQAQSGQYDVMLG